jgi:hypothetical protein
MMLGGEFKWKTFVLTYREGQGLKSASTAPL